jgi:hypothetical protein
MNFTEESSEIDFSSEMTWFNEFDIPDDVVMINTSLLNLIGQMDTLDLIDYIDHLVSIDQNSALELIRYIDLMDQNEIYYLDQTNRLKMDYLDHSLICLVEMGHCGSINYFDEISIYNLNLVSWYIHIRIPKLVYEYYLYHVT